jgi:hypothetical protein
METLTGLTRVTVNLNAPAAAALESASEMTGDSRTDTVNRALQVYAELVRLRVEEGCGDVVVERRTWCPLVRVTRRLSWNDRKADAPPLAVA